jgi:hypothetical protein
MQISTSADFGFSIRPRAPDFRLNAGANSCDAPAGKECREVITVLRAIPLIFAFSQKVIVMLNHSIPLGLSLTALSPAAAWYFIVIVCHFFAP